MVAPHPIQEADEFNSHLPDLDDSEHLLDLNFDGVGDNLFLEDGVEEDGGVLFEHGLGVGLLLVEFYPEELP